MKSILARLKVWHLAHRGETVAHVTYLCFTFIEGHGGHAVAAAAVVGFMVIGAISGGQHE